MRSGRIWFVLLTACLGCAAAPQPSVAPHADAKGPDARALAVADLLVADTFEESPAYVALLRPPGARYDALPDDSVAGVAARQTRRDAWLAQLRAIDRADLTREDARLAYDLARERLQRLSALRVCRFEVWAVSQMGGWQVELADTALNQPVDTPERRAQALARFGALPAYVDDQIAALSVGLSEGRTAPRGVVDLVIGQLDALIASPPEESPFASPAFRAGDPAFREQYLAMYAGAVRPALQRMRDFLARNVAPRARTEVGLSALPDGAACYRAALAYSTTLDVDPADVQARGMAALGEIEARMTEIARVGFGGDSLPRVRERLRSDPAFLFKDDAHILALAEAALARAWKVLPRAFSTIPRAQAVLEPIPAFQASTASAHYLAAALDGSRPAAYRVRLYDAKHQSVATGEAIAFHEVVPGHHLQISLANEQQGLPQIARFLVASGFAEGWALYAEQLADELGLYTGEVDRFGMLSTRSWRAVRMVVDPGLHVGGWSREKAVAFLVAHTALSPQQAGQEIDRYIAMPGQAPSYLLGYQEILSLRADAQARLGAGFDLEGFHAAVLSRGGVSLPLLRAQIEAFVAQQAAHASIR